MEEAEFKIKAAEHTLLSVKSTIQSGTDDEQALKELISFKKESREIVKLLQDLEVQQREEEKDLDQHYWKNQCIGYEKSKLQAKIAIIRNYESPQLKKVMNQNLQLSLELDGTKLDEETHEQNMELLQAEEKLRKEMSDEVLSLKEKKIKLQEELKLKKMGLASMPKLVTSIKNATIPVQEKLNIKFSKNKTLFQQATTLPRPLYILLHKFHEFATINNLQDSLEISVVSVRKEEHETFVKSGSPKNQTEEEGEMPQVEQSKQKSKRRKKIKPSIKNIWQYLDTHQLKESKSSPLSPSPVPQGLSVKITKPIFDQSVGSEYFPLSLIYKYYNDSSTVTVFLDN